MNTHNIPKQFHLKLNKNANFKERKKKCNVIINRVLLKTRAIKKSQQPFGKTESTIHTYASHVQHITIEKV